MAEPQPPAVVLLSGGLDSATALAVARCDGFRCHALASMADHAPPFLHAMRDGGVSPIGLGHGGIRQNGLSDPQVAGSAAV